MNRGIYEETVMCKVDVGCSLNDLKEAMLHIKRTTGYKTVYGIFNGQLYIAYFGAKTIDDVKKF